MKSRFAWYLIVYVYVALFSLLIASYGYADELLFKFKSPSFSGINSSSHYLTIENQENTRRGTIKQEREAELDAIKREENNSTLSRFMRNFESRVYAQLSRQLVEQLFGENPSTEGKLELEGNLIEYVVAEDTITLTITDENDGQTTITIPVGDFTF
mgnify:FL=1|tara:strand:+ start:6074 stop:6544 length:471 start_codon:yes stop_codon:yes gene_type:complete